MKSQEKSPSITTREFTKAGATAIAATPLGVPSVQAATAKAAITLPSLPFAPDQLEPTISAKTISFHYGKHHQAYVGTLNKLIAGTDYAGMDIVCIIRKAAAGGENQHAIFNNAAQAWNHTFYWNSLSPKGKTLKPCKKLLAAIERSFGSMDACLAALSQAALTQFGSGWAWLVLKDGKIAVRKTSNADTPIAHPGVTPLLTIDVWEHAYYLDWQNKRADYVKAVLENLVNWDFAAANFAAAQE